MDVEKALKIAGEYLTDYVAVFFLTLRSPGIRFVPVDATSVADLGFPTSRDRLAATRGAALSPKLMVFVALSLAIGTLVTNAFPGRQNAPEIIESVVMAGLWWGASSTIVHVLCRLLRGRGSLESTFSVTLQVFSVVFVLSAFVSFIVAAGCRSLSLAGTSSAIMDLLSDAALVYQFVSAPLLLAYVPASLRPVHGFGWPRTVALALALVLLLVLGGIVSLLVIESTGVLLPRPRR